MNRNLLALCCTVSAVLILCLSTSAQKSRRSIEIVPARSYAPLKLETSAELQELLDGAVGQVMASFPDGKFKREEIAATLIDLRDAGQARWASFRGEEKIYPASVVKMFYMVALERQLEDGKLVVTKELERGLRDMIVDSSNEATQYMLDVLTDTSSGAELPEKDFVRWQHQRNRVNRFYSAMGYSNINVNQKTHCEDAYGVEQQSRKYSGQNRNMLTTNSTARLLAEIASGRINTPERTKRMMDLMARDWSKPSSDPDNQAVGFTGKALIDAKLTRAKLWSKAGWTSRSRHDAAYVETPDGLKFVLVVFTENHANDRGIIPTVTATIIQKMRR